VIAWQGSTGPATTLAFITAVARSAGAAFAAAAEALLPVHSVLSVLKCAAAARMG